MMELIRAWLTGITAAAIVAAAADSLTPEGTVKKIGKLAGGLLLMLAILQPLMGLDYQALAGALADYRIEAQGYGSALENENRRLMKTIIEERTGAYIQDKAAGLGAACTVQVTCGTDGEGNLYPASVVVYGKLTEEQRQALGRIIEGEVAISAENQRYERTTE